MHEFFVTGDGLSGDGMYHWISLMFKVGDQLFYSVLHEDAGCAHGIHRHLLLDGEYVNSLLCHDPLSALLGIVCTVVGGIVGCVIVRGDLCCCGNISSLSLSGIVLLLLFIGTPPGVLFLVTRPWCICECSF
jgi:hypothetical protein